MSYENEEGKTRKRWKKEERLRKPDLADAT